MRRWISLLLPIIGLVLFVVIVRHIGVEQIMRTLGAIDPKQLLVFPVFVLFFHLTRGLRWQILMKAADIDFSYRKSVLLWSVGFFAGAVTPGKVGDALRAYFLSRETKKDFGQCFATVFVDRLMDLVTILGGGLVTTIIFSVYYIEVSSLWGVAGGVIAILGLMYLVLNRELMRKLVGPLVRAVLPPDYVVLLRKHFHSFYDVLGKYGKRRWQTLLAYVLALVYWAGIVLMAVAVTRVLGIDVSPTYILIIMPMLTLAEFLPISISGLGTRDAVAVYVFSVVGVSSAEAVGFSILYLIAGTYITALVGSIVWLFRPDGLRRKPRRDVLS